MRTMPPRQSLRSDAQRRLRRRVQAVYQTFHRFPMESRPDGTAEAHRHLLDVRKAQELLSVLHCWI